MFDLLRRLLAVPATGSAAADAPVPRRAAAPTPSPTDQERRLRLAACALLVELARADGEFADAERVHVARLMSDAFGLAAGEAQALLTAADTEVREAVDLHEFVTVVNARYDDVERGALAEMLWKVADADGVLSAHESYLIRRLGTLLDLPPGALEAARARAAAARDGGA
jgi:uncharacterized tellurite resistance protein B-like protein